MVGIPSRGIVEKVKNSSPRLRISLGHVLRAWTPSADVSKVRCMVCWNSIGVHGIVPRVPLFTAGDMTNLGLYRRNRTSYTPLRLRGHNSDHVRPGSATWGLLDKGSEIRINDEHRLGTTAVYHACRCWPHPFAIHHPGESEL